MGRTLPESPNTITGTATQNTITGTVLDAIYDLPVMQKYDTSPATAEFSKVIDSLASGKAPGSDGSPPEILKSRKFELRKSLLELLCLCWGKGCVPQT